MSTLATASPSLDVLRPLAGLKTPAAAAMSVAEQAKRAQIKQSAQDFEASFLSQAFGSMFQGVKTAPPFGGGSGEDAFKSFLYDAMAKAVVKKGGIGLAASVQHEMLKMQGLSEEPST
jgi:Rod binding domain-containing protein